MNELQNTLLDMYKSIKEICNQENIRFYALGGTLLGAVRHAGFIPWDDDIDLAIPRPDYDRFIEIANKSLPGHLALTTYSSPLDDTEVLKYFARVRNLNTKVLTQQGNVDVNEPLWIDIFPLDAMPSSKIKRTMQKYRLLFKRLQVQFALYDQITHQHRANRPFHEKALMKIREITHIGSNLNAVDLYEKTEAIARKYDYQSESWIVNLFGAYKFKEMFPKSWFENTVTLQFEDTTIDCPKEYDKVLTRMYGDYENPPSEEERANQHMMTVLFLNNADSEGQSR